VKPPEPREPARGLAPRSVVRGTFRPPGSKALAQRALLCAALCEAETALEGLSDADDVRAALALVEAAGADVRGAGADRVFVRGRPPGPDDGLAPRATLDIGESGTLARLATALVALASRPRSAWTIEARGSLLLRRSRPLFDALTAAGARILRQNLPGTWPVELESAVPPERVVLRRPASSQEVSALLLALAAHEGARELEVHGAIPSAPYVAMSERVLARFGADVRAGTRDGARIFAVRGPLVAPAAPIAIEPDASTAAVVLAAAVLSGGEVLVPGLARDSVQGDVRIVEHLCAFGCDARHEGDGLSARGAPRHGAELDLAGEPDLAPVLAAVAAGAALRTGAASRLTGLGTLPGKESDRLSTLKVGLERLGLTVEAGDDFLSVAPGDRAPIAGELDPEGDHRMAFAFALLGLLAPGLRVRDPGCVAKSWPSFWGDLERLGAGTDR
jgi:3-phosphoshikimate 1-carboxyvinyltransferase